MGNNNSKEKKGEKIGQLFVEEKNEQLMEEINETHSSPEERNVLKKNLPFTWEKLMVEGKVPSERNFSSCCFVGNKLYVFGL